MHAEGKGNVITINLLRKVVSENKNKSWIFGTDTTCEGQLYISEKKNDKTFLRLNCILKVELLSQNCKLIFYNVHQTELTSRL